MRTIIVLSFALAISSQCSADTRWVTKTTDTDTQGELRYEIWSATPGDVIQFHSDLYGQVVEIAFPRSDIIIDKDLTIEGPGADLITIDGAPGYRIFQLVGSISVHISGVTLTGGRSADMPGGAIFVPSDATLTVDGCYFVDNMTLTPVPYQNGLLHGGAIFNQGTLTVENSTFERNKVGSPDPGYASPDGHHGGAIFNMSGGSLIVRSSTFVGNQAGSGVNCENCSDDKESGDGGHGGAIYNAGQAQVYYSTITENETGLGFDDPTGGSHFSGSGGGIYNSGSAYFKLVSTIVAENLRVQWEEDLKGAFHTASVDNVIGTDPGSDYTGLSTASNQLGVDARLDTLGYWGGPTPTIRPRWSSPALENGSCPDVTSDQRGFPRPADTYWDSDSVADCDVGAVEYQHRVEASIKVYLEGSYVGGGLMSKHPDLPEDQPYGTPPWNYPGPEAVGDPADLNSATDWVLAHLAVDGPVTGSIRIVRTRGVLLQNDGYLDNLYNSTNDFVYFDDTPSGRYYVIVQHRNHLGVMSVGKFDLSQSAEGLINLTGASSCHGTNPLRDLSGTGAGPWAMYACDGDANGVVEPSDFNDFLTATASGAAGYLPEDYNLDGAAQTLDANPCLENIILGATSQIPAVWSP